MYSIDYDAVFTLPNLIFIAVLILYNILITWKIFVKAGQPGWAAIIPFYNMYILSKIVFNKGWYFLLIFIPVVSFFFSIIMYFQLGKRFGKETGFCIGLLFLSIIFMSILAFDSSEYQGVQN